MSSYASIGQSLSPSTTFGRAVGSKSAAAAVGAASPQRAVRPASTAASPVVAAAAAAPAVAAKPTVDTDDKEPSKRFAGYGIVKAVKSGDTLVVMGIAKDGEIAPERELTLSGLTAPKYQRGKSGQDEPWAYHSREFLRKKLIGRQVKFSINHVLENGSRSYAYVHLNDENINHAVVRNGWANSKSDKGGKIHPDRAELIELQDKAEASGLGMWNKTVAAKDMVRTVNYNPNLQDLFDRYQNKQLPAVVDYVREGSTMRCELVSADGSLKHTMVQINLTAVAAPSLPLPYSYLMSQYERKVANSPKGTKIDKPKREAVVPFAAEAQNYTEARLLHREVKIVLQGIDKSENLFATVLYAAGNISRKLVEYGLAKVIKWCVPMTIDGQNLLGVQALSQKKQVGMWAGYTPTVDAATVEINGKVTSVASGDCVTITDDAGVETKVFLSSVRAPRIGGRREKPEPWGLQAKEALRRKFIGMRVRAIIDYKSTNARGEQLFVTLVTEKFNAAREQLVEGLVSVSRHRIEDDRSPYYAQFLALEREAVKAKKGMHGNGGEVRFVDLTERFRPRRGEEATEAQTEKAEAHTAKAKQYLPFLQRGKNLVGIVEHEFGPDRFKIYVPSQQIMMSFVLAGITTREAPAAVKEAALKMIRAKVHQQAVRIEVETIDRGDNFLGSMFVDKQNIAVTLLEMGYANTYKFSADKSKHAEDLYAAEAKAKAQLIGVWEGWTEPEAAEAAEDAAAEEEIQDYGNGLKDVTITEIIDGVNFYVTMPSSAKDATKIAEVLKEVDPDDYPEDWVANRGMLCAAKFSDDQWYRVKCEKGDYEHGEVPVFFMDFGNSDTISIDNVVPLPESIAKIKPLAKACVLAGLKAPRADSEYAEDAAHMLNELTGEGIEVIGKVECVGKEDGKLHMTLSTKESAVTVNQQMVRDGWLRVLEGKNVERGLKDLCKSLKPDQATAISARVNIWEYGDVSDDEDEDLPKWKSDGRPPSRAQQLEEKAAAKKAAEALKLKRSGGM